MFFKTDTLHRCIQLFAALVLSFFLNSCHIKTGEKAPPDEPFNFGVSCLDETYTYLDKFFQGEGQERQIRFATQCAVNVLTKFKDKVRGESDNQYTSDELRDFIENNFLNSDRNKPARRISDAFLNQLMLIKKLIVGGSDVHVTIKEIDLTIDFLGVVEDHLVQLNPYMKVYLFLWHRDLSEETSAFMYEERFKKDIEYFELANAQLQKFVDVIADLVARNNSQYSLDNFPILADEIDSFDGSQTGLGERFYKYMRVVKKVKKAMTGGDENFVATSEWSAISRVVSRGFIQVLRYNYFFKDIRESNLNFQLPYITNALSDIFDAMSDVLCRKNASFKPSVVSPCDNQNAYISELELFDIGVEVSNVFPDFRISKKLVSELMKVKVLLVGGRFQNISAFDFNEAKNKVPFVRQFLERINPHAKILLLNWDPASYANIEDALDYFDRAQSEIQTAFLMIADNLSSSYGLNDFRSLLQEFLSLYKDKEDLLVQDPAAPRESPLRAGLSFAEAFVELYDFVFSLKKVITDNTSEKIEKLEWKGFLVRLHDVYHLYSYDYYFAPKDSSYKVDETIEHYQQILIRAVPIVNSILEAKANKGISFEEVLDIYTSAKNSAILPVEFSEKFLRLVYDELINRILLSPQERLRGLKFKYFNMRHFLNLYTELRTNLDVLKNFYTLTQDATREVLKSEILSTLSNLLRNQNFQSEAESLAQIPYFSPDFQQKLLAEKNAAYQQLYKLFTTSPVEINLDEKSIFIMAKGNRPYTMQTLKTLMLYRFAADIIVKSYAGEISRVNALQSGSLLLTELYEFIAFAGPILSELKVYEGANNDFIDSRFLEANVFLPRSKWDDKADFYEIHDLLVHIFSGLKIHEIMKEKMSEEELPGCPLLNTETPLFSLSCYSKRFKKFVSDQLVALPGFQAFAKSKNDSTWLAFMKKTVTASGVFVKDPNKIDIKEMLLTPQLLQYLEMIYFKYDKNNDGLISTLESREAFGSFQGIMKDLAKEELASGSLKQSQLYDLFTYILKHKKPPETTWEKIKFKFRWIDKDKDWNLKVSRQDTVEILEFIANEIKNKKDFKIDLKLEDVHQ